MPRTFQRPNNLPNDIPIYHITARDADADLILKVTALESYKSAIIPVFKEDMVEILPTYFGMIFDKNKSYTFRENHLQLGEFFEISIPNLKEPKNIAIFLKDKLEPKIIGLSNEATNAVNKCYDWPEFYWIANYFNEDVWLMEIIENLLKFTENCSKE